MSLIGTFLVRSGVLTSVHSFAVDPTRGVFILVLIALVIGGGLVLYALRAPGLETGNPFAPVSREGALVLNNLLLVRRHGDGVSRHLLSALRRGLERRQVVGRPAIFRRDLCADPRPGDRRDGDRPGARLAARQSQAALRRLAPALSRRARSRR